MTTQQVAAAAVDSAAPPEGSAFWTAYARTVRLLVYALVAVAALGICAMMAVTCFQVILRMFDKSLTGVVDIVKIAGAVTMAGSLPYTTACKGHVAIEYFFQKLGRRSRAIVDAFTRICMLVLFAFLTFECATTVNRCGLPARAPRRCTGRNFGCRMCWPSPAAWSAW